MNTQRRATLGRVLGKGITLLVSLAVFSPQPTHSACNLIPLAELRYRGETGSVRDPITSVGETVRLVIESDNCAGSAGFKSTADLNTVTVMFEPPTGMTPVPVEIDPLTISVDDCVGVKPFEESPEEDDRCATLTFPMPDTSSTPDGWLAGPARITVVDDGANTVAEIGRLNRPSAGCGPAPDNVFVQFTVLPPANSFKAVEDLVPVGIGGTIDGGGNLLVPFDYYDDGGPRNILPAGIGSPIARLVRATVTLEAFDGGGTGIADQIIAQPDPNSLISSHTLDGRRLPPLLRIATEGPDTGQLVGTVDARASVIRFQRFAHDGTELFDLSDRMVGDVGPIFIPIADVTVISDVAVPLAGLRKSDPTIAFPVEELLAGSDINSDGDDTDLIAHRLDAITGVLSTTDETVAQIAPRGHLFAFPALDADEEVLAYLSNEFGQSDTLGSCSNANPPQECTINADCGMGIECIQDAFNFGGQKLFDLNDDNDSFDTYVNVQRLDTRIVDPFAPMDPTDAAIVEAAPHAVLNGRALVLSKDQVFYRNGSPAVDIENVFAQALGLVEITDAALSATGAHLYAVGSRGLEANDPLIAGTGVVAEFDRDDTSGALTFDAASNAIEPRSRGMRFDSIVVSPDGLHAYVAGKTSYRCADIPSLGFPCDPLYGDATCSTNADCQADIQNRIVAYDVDPTDEFLTAFGETYQGQGLTNTIDGVSKLAITGDGDFLLVATHSTGEDNNLMVIRRSGGGALSEEFVYRDGIENDDLSGANGIAFRENAAPDDRDVYVITGGRTDGNNDQALLYFTQDKATGELTHRTTLKHPVTKGLERPTDIAISPDRRHLYITSEREPCCASPFEDPLSEPGTIAVFWLQPIEEPPASGIFIHDPTFIEAIDPPSIDEPGNHGVFAPRSIEMSPEGLYVHVLSSDVAEIALLRRNPRTGSLIHVESTIAAGNNVSPSILVSNGSNGNMGSGGAAGVSPRMRRQLLSPDGRQSYILDSTNTVGAITAWHHDIPLGSLDIGGLVAPVDVETIDPANAPLATTVAVSAERALFLMAEPYVRSGDPLCSAPVGSGCDLNSDGDIGDEVAWLYDLSGDTDALTSLGVAANRTALAPNYLAITVPEFNARPMMSLCGVANTGRCDLNGDNDDRDDVVLVAPTNAPATLTNIGVGAVQIGFSGDTLVLIVSEEMEGVSLNADVDTTDLILHIYDPATDTLTNTGLSALEFVIDEQLIAFRRSEAQEGIELNGHNMPPLDHAVMSVIDLCLPESDWLFNSGQSAVTCIFGGCDFFRPYAPKVVCPNEECRTTPCGPDRAPIVTFLTDESDENKNLDGDANADEDDIVLQNYALRVDRDGDGLDLGEVFVINTVRDASELPGELNLLSSLDPIKILPIDNADGLQTNHLVNSCDAGIDEACDSLVYVIAGDADNDGIFDDDDLCPLNGCPRQRDTDADGLCDECNDPAFSCPSLPAPGCRQGTAGGSSILIKDRPGTRSDQLKWKWGKGEATLVEDFGDPTDLGLPALYTFCLYDSGSRTLDAPLMSKITCGNKPCFKLGKKGFRYKDKDGTSSGIQLVKTKAGETGKAKLQFKAKGDNLTLPTLPALGDITAQAFIREGQREDCWSTTFSASTKNTDELYKAKGP